MESLPQPAKSREDELLPTRPSLLARLRNEDDSKAWHRGWEEFYLRYHPVIYRHALKCGLREADAEDVVQEIVIGVARSLPQFKYDPAVCSFKTWLFRVARNKIANHLRKRGRQSRGLVAGMETEHDPDVLAEVADDKVLTPDKEWDLVWEANLRRAALEHVKNRVKPMTMRLYLFHVEEGHSVEDTAAHFRDSQVKSSEVHLAKHRVQKMVDQTLDRMRKGESPP